MTETLIELAGKIVDQAHAIEKRSEELQELLFPLTEYVAPFKFISTHKPEEAAE